MATVQNIAMICDSMEAGKNGVGDYSRLLGHELKKRSHRVNILACSDPYVSHESIETQRDVDCLRLPRKLTLDQRMIHIENWLKQTRPDAIMLHYVPYAYQSKGLPLAFIHRLKQVVMGKPIHWLCHEIWCGLSRHSTLRERIIGFAQKSLLARFLRDAGHIYVTNPYYQRLLSTIVNQPVQLLPLFSTLDGPYALDIANRRYARAQAVPRIARDDLVFVIFGRIPDEFIHQQVLERIGRQLESLSRCGHILSLGRLDAGEAIWRRIEALDIPQLTFTRLGELSEKMASVYLCAADFGLAATPLDAIGKSASCASMLERGLPVIGYHQNDKQIGIAPDWHAPGQIMDIDVLQPTVLSNPPRFQATSRVQDVANRLLSSLALS